MDRLRKFLIKLKNALHRFNAFIEKVTFKQWAAFITAVVAILTFNVQVLQFRAEVDEQWREIKTKSFDEAKRAAHYRIALAHEISSNLQRSIRAIDQYEKDTLIDPAPLYVSDMYKAGLVSGDLFGLNYDLQSALLDFYKTLPEYQELAEYSERDIIAVQREQATCAENGKDCDLYRWHVKELRVLRSKSLIDTVRTQNDLLKKAIKHLGD